MSKRRARPAVADPDRSARYAELVAEAKAKGCDPAWPLCVLQFKSLEQVIVAGGEIIDTADFLRLADLIKSLQPPPKPVTVTIDIVHPSLVACPSCGCEFNPESPDEKKHAAAKAATPPPDTNGSSPPSQTENSPPAVTEVQASTPVPARPAPPPPPPPAPPISETMRAWNRHQGYNRSARDGGLIKGAAVPHVDPNLTNALVYENYDNDKPSCFTGYQGRASNPAPADPNPAFHSDGTARKPYEPPY